MRTRNNDSLLLLLIRTSSLSIKTNYLQCNNQKCNKTNDQAHEEQQVVVLVVSIEEEVKDYFNVKRERFVVLSKDEWKNLQKLLSLGSSSKKERMSSVENAKEVLRNETSLHRFLVQSVTVASRRYCSCCCCCCKTHLFNKNHIPSSSGSQEVSIKKNDKITLLVIDDATRFVRQFPASLSITCKYNLRLVNERMSHHQREKAQQIIKSIIMFHLNSSPFNRSSRELVYQIDDLRRNPKSWPSWLIDEKGEEQATKQETNNCLVNRKSKFKQIANVISNNAQTEPDIIEDNSEKRHRLPEQDEGCDLSKKRLLFCDDIEMMNNLDETSCSQFDKLAEVENEVEKKEKVGDINAHIDLQQAAGSIYRNRKLTTNREIYQFMSIEGSHDFSTKTGEIITINNSKQDDQCPIISDNYQQRLQEFSCSSINNNFKHDNDFFFSHKLHNNKNRLKIFLQFIIYSLFTSTLLLIITPPRNNLVVECTNYYWPLRRLHQNQNQQQHHPYPLASQQQPLHQDQLDQQQPQQLHPVDQRQAAAAAAVVAASSASILSSEQPVSSQFASNSGDTELASQQQQQQSSRSLVLLPKPPQSTTTTTTTNQMQKQQSSPLKRHQLLIGQQYSNFSSDIPYSLIQDSDYGSMVDVAGQVLDDGNTDVSGNIDGYLDQQQHHQPDHPTLEHAQTTMNHQTHLDNRLHQLLPPPSEPSSAHLLAPGSAFNQHRNYHHQQQFVDGFPVGLPLNHQHETISSLSSTSDNLRKNDDSNTNSRALLPFSTDNSNRLMMPQMQQIKARFNQGCVGGTKCQFFAFCWMSGGSLGASCGLLMTCCVTPSRHEIQPGFYGPVVNDPYCGRSTSKINRIVGGTDASFGQFPWQAFVQVGGSRCGGALISSRHVVTAGHCVARSQHSPASIKVTLGDYILNSDIESIPHEVFSVVEVFLHPNFRFTPQADRYDVAVLELDRQASYKDNIKPICLPQKDAIFVGRVAYVAGWGALQAGSKLRPKVLQHVAVPVIENPVCESWHRRKGIDIRIYDEMMCAGYELGQRDACQGDSGGPLMLNQFGVWYLVGIVSAGYSCAKQYQPGIYHRVSSSSDWISSNVYQQGSTK